VSNRTTFYGNWQRCHWAQSLQHQIFQASTSNVKHQHQKTQDCYKNFLYNTVPILHIQHRFMTPSLWLIIAASTAVGI